MLITEAHMRSLMVPTCTHQAGCLKQTSGSELWRMFVMITVIAVDGDIERPI